MITNWYSMLCIFNDVFIIINWLSRSYVYHFLFRILFITWNKLIFVGSSWLHESYFHQIKWVSNQIFHVNYHSTILKSFWSWAVSLKKWKRFWCIFIHYSKYVYSLCYFSIEMKHFFLSFSFWLLLWIQRETRKKKIMNIHRRCNFRLINCKQSFIVQLIYNICAVFFLFVDPIWLWAIAYAEPAFRSMKVSYIKSKMMIIDSENCCRFKEILIKLHTENITSKLHRKCG